MSGLCKKCYQKTQENKPHDKRKLLYSAVPCWCDSCGRFDFVVVGRKGEVKKLKGAHENA